MTPDNVAAAHGRAFSVAAAMPAGRLAAIRDVIDRLLETGAAFDTARTALQGGVIAATNRRVS